MSGIQADDLFVSMLSRLRACVGSISHSSSTPSLRRGSMSAGRTVSSPHTSSRTPIRGRALLKETSMPASAVGSSPWQTRNSTSSHPTADPAPPLPHRSPCQIMSDEQFEQASHDIALAVAGTSLPFALQNNLRLVRIDICCATAWIQREYCPPDEQAGTNPCSAAPGSPEAAEALLDAKHGLATQDQNVRLRTRLQVSKEF